MLYAAHDMQRAWLAGVSIWADAGAQMLKPLAPVPAAALHVLSHASASRGKPEFGLSCEEEIILDKPFCQLRKLQRQGSDADPKLLIVAPMSGHFATLLRGTVERMLPKHQVYVTDWRDARDVPLSDGNFDLDDYVDYLREFLEAIGPRTHMLAVCQPSVPCLAVTALMAEDKHSCRPASLTMMGGPIDTRCSPTAVNKLAMERPYCWFEQNVIETIPARYAGAGRKVYPGFLQLTGFLTMNLGNHLISHWEMFKHLATGDAERATSIGDFYAEYRSVCDMTAEFYLQTIDRVFQRHLLPKGEMMHRDRRINLLAITDVAILAVEGERDDISGIGQTKAALDLTTNLPKAKKHYHLADGAGHYGIFNGSKWRDHIAPVVEDWIEQHSR
jgi:poly(3-hydroxybutyrate) depolymerase